MVYCHRVGSCFNCLEQFCFDNELQESACNCVVVDLCTDMCAKWNEGVFRRQNKIECWNVEEKQAASLIALLVSNSIKMLTKPSVMCVSIELLSR